MTENETGGPAFPPSNPGYAHGMTLRDYFAAKALQAMLCRVDQHGSASDYAKMAYVTADAMLKARSV